MIVLLIVAVGTLITGVLAVLYGLSYKEFSFGNTIVLAGVIGSCTGLLLFGLWMVTRDMRAIARRLVMPTAAKLHDPSLPEFDALSAKPQFPSRPPSREPAMSAAPARIEPEPPSFPETSVEERHEPRSAPPDLAPTPVAEPAPKPRRNLLFESSVRKDRERPQPGNGAAPAIEATQRPTSDSFDRNGERADRAQRARSPSTYPDPRTEAASAVTVLKSGVVDGMAYSLYSDGSIEAQMPEGMMRFGSIEELRAHLDQRT